MDGRIKPVQPYLISLYAARPPSDENGQWQNRHKAGLIAACDDVEADERAMGIALREWPPERKWRNHEAVAFALPLQVAYSVGGGRVNELYGLRFEKLEKLQSGEHLVLGRTRPGLGDG